MTAPAIEAWWQRRPDVEQRSAATLASLVSQADRQELLRAYRELVPSDPRIEPHLAAVLAHVTMSPGSLVRGQLIFSAADRFGIRRRDARLLAIAIEYFHAASLLFDDLPMMDDARERRGRACAHQLFGESASVLGALALINQSYDLIWTALESSGTQHAARAQALVTACLGVRGVLSGQTRDLHFAPEGASEERVLEVAREKTVPMVGGASESTLQALDRLAMAWGLSYQILDDCKDRLPRAARRPGATTLSVGPAC